jgi:hypothetical protein
MYKKLLLLLLTLAVVIPCSGSSAQKRKDSVDEPMIDFSHRYAKINMTMTLTKLKTFNKFLPKSLRREVGDEYYPEIRRQLKGKETGSMHYKEGDAEIQSYPDGKVRLTLKFPNFIMVIRNVTWDQLDVVFSEYF